MKHNKIVFTLLITLILLCISLGSVSAEEMVTTQTETVSGGVIHESTNPWNTTGSVSIEIPETATNVTYAEAIINIYAGSAQPTYAANTSIKLEYGNAVDLINEELISTTGSTDGTVYTINDHTTKVYSDYEITYDLTNKIQTLQAGQTITLNVETSKLGNYSFDGRIKALTLILAYNDGDEDKITYWINSKQQWSNDTTSTTFETEGITGDIDAVTLTNLALSSGVAKYEFNNNILEEEIAITGNYYALNTWDVTEYYNPDLEDNIFTYTGAVSSYSGKISFKNIYSILVVEQIEPYNITVTNKPEYSSGQGAIYAGVNNTLSLNITSNEDTSAEVTIIVLNDDYEVAETTTILNPQSSQIIKITDPTIRPITEDTVLSTNNTKTEYTILVFKNNKLISNTTYAYPVLYNGYLGKDYEYTIQDPTLRVINFNGNFYYKIQDESKYMAAGTTTKTEIFNVEFNYSSIEEALIYVSYNWDKTKAESPLFTTITYYRDQSNMESYGTYGYGLIVYDVSSLIKSGENTFVLEKEANLTAVYPTTLLIFTNEEDANSTLTAYVLEEADLLSAQYNVLPRDTSYKSTFEIEETEAIGSSWFVFASNDMPNRATLTFNDETFTDVFNGTSKTTGVYVANVTDILDYENDAVFNVSGSTILALQQVLVVESITGSPIIETEDLIEVYGEHKNFTGKLLDAYGNPLKGQHVALNLTRLSSGASKVYYATTDYTGTYTLEINLAPGYYTVSSSADYEGTTVESLSRIIISADNTTNSTEGITILTANALNAQYGSSPVFTGKLMDTYGDEIVGHYVNVKLSNARGQSKVYTVVTDYMGIYSLPINLAPGTYYAECSFDGFDTYQASSAYNTITIY